MENDIFFNLTKSNQTNQLRKLIGCNSYTKKFGVFLSEEETLFLLESRKNTLINLERVEFGEGILPKLIFAFCDSPYIYQDNYKDTLEGLQEIFYLYKNESLDELSDDELLSYMKQHFDDECQGSLEYLEDTCLEDFCRKIRSGKSIMEEGEVYDTL